MAVHDRRDAPAACPDAEHLAQYAEGGLAAEDRAQIERHLVDCPDCRAVLAETMAFAQSEAARAAHATNARVVPFRSRRWVTGTVAGLAIAAALVLAVRVARPEWVAGWFGPRSDRPELQELVAALATEPTRPVEGRLTGGFKYAPPPSPTRGAGDRDAPPEVRMAAANLEKQARDQKTPASQAASGVASLALGDVDRAIASLDSAVARSAPDAQLFNDLAVAYLARAQRRESAEDLRQALAAADRATSVSTTLVEPWFNRALALQKLQMRDEARQAWEEYLRRDSSSQWAEEARAFLAAARNPTPGRSG